MAKNIYLLIINIGLFIFGISAVFTGMLIQVKYHMGNHGNIAIYDHVFGINHSGWSVIHKISIVILFLLMIYHIYRHWKWYKAVISKRLLKKNQLILLLSLFFILSAITGLTAWFTDMLTGDQVQRKDFIEIHDKLTIVLSIYIILHIIKKSNWYISAFRKLKYLNSH